MKEFRCFIENATLASPDTHHTPVIYEISEEGKTYAKRRERKSIKGDDKNLIQSFHTTEENRLTEEYAVMMVKVVEAFNGYVETMIIENKPAIMAGFVKFFNHSNKEHLSDFSYNIIIKVGDKKYPDYLSFKIEDIKCSVWLSDRTFKLFYPLYDIDVVTPFEEFDTIVKKPSEMLAALGKFDLNKFARRQDEVKDGYPSTFSRVLNIPYRPRKDLKTVDCWFGFNIYGAAGDYEHLMREKLYDYLKDLGLSDEWIEDHFPSIFEVNEFFIVPEWTDYALPNRNNQGSINSQVNKAYSAPFNMPKYVKAYDGKDNFMRANTYNVPIAYNNLMCRVLNGVYTQEEVQDFKKYYGDLITVSSTSPDFARMSTKTQRFLIVLNHMINVSDAIDQTELFNKLMSDSYLLDNKLIKFAIAVRRGVTYISTYYDQHRYFMVPRYEFERIEKEK